MSEEKPKPGPSKTRILLIVSLAANLLVAGVVAGAFFSGGPEKRGPGRGYSNLPLGPYGRAFSKEDRADLRAAFEARKPWFDKSRRQMRGFGKEMAAAMRAEPFDAAAITDILARQSAVWGEIQAEGQKLFVERVSAMTPDQRAAFADKLEKGMNRGKRNR